MKYLCASMALSIIASLLSPVSSALSSTEGQYDDNDTEWVNDEREIINDYGTVLAAALMEGPPLPNEDEHGGDYVADFADHKALSHDEARRLLTVQSRTT